MLQLKWNYLGSARICRVGVRPELLAAADVRIRQPLRGRPRIGVAARLASGKGVCLALYALKYLREQGVDVTLAVAGDGPERQGLRNLTARLGLEAYVDWLGSVQDMAAFYSSIDVLLHPTLHEALGNVTIEAGIFGVPVVATRVDGMAETVVHGHSGVTVPADEPISSYAEFGGTGGHIPVGQVFDPDTDSLRPLGFAHPRALATAVAGIVNDAEVHVRMSKAAESHVREHFSFEQYVQEFISSVHAFLGESAHNRETVT